MRWVVLIICWLLSNFITGYRPRDDGHDRYRQSRSIPTPPVVNLSLIPKLDTPTIEMVGSEYVVTLTGTVDVEQSMMYYWRLRSATTSWSPDVSWFAFQPHERYKDASKVVSFTTTVVDTLTFGTLTKPWYAQVMVLCRSGISCKSSWVLLPWEFD